ncbi:DUF1499 domain-containing protein [Halomonas daqiaonensis]|uniref:DUF1499 domain-containing protein n=1 Tax=Halomonas daqiaonensis TaxID=650850 RepID=A0A1H7QRH9_9GAMM|nr:DUF1499 domain-containing protein [Halomonas daqiaonensis]SEL50499.1 Protein of unknown function [Halomonas daqiaonensis]
MTREYMTSGHRGVGLAFKLALAGGILALLAALSMAGAGPTYRTGLLSLGDAFSMLRYGAYIALGAAGLGLLALLIAAFTRRALPALLSGLVILASLVLVTVPWMQLQQAQAVPPIHDITTDMQDPPAFDALVQAREAAPNAVDYPGEATARQQREAYPAIQPLVLDAPLPEVLAAAEAEARDAGWEIAAVDDTRIEATATTTWFGFKDDVVIRLTETPDGVQVDMRSASRLGRGDVGTNAARIRAFLKALERRLTPQ